MQYEINIYEKFNYDLNSSSCYHQFCMQEGVI